MALWFDPFHSLWICSEVKLLGRVVILHSIFGGTSGLFSITSTPFYGPSSSVQSILTNTLLKTFMQLCSNEYFTVFDLLFTSVVYSVDACFYLHWLLGTADTGLVYLEDYPHWWVYSLFRVISLLTPELRFDYSAQLFLNVSQGFSPILVHFITKRWPIHSSQCVTFYQCSQSHLRSQIHACHLIECDRWLKHLIQIYVKIFFLFNPQSTINGIYWETIY